MYTPTTETTQRHLGHLRHYIKNIFSVEGCSLPDKRGRKGNDNLGNEPHSQFHVFPTLPYKRVMQ